MKFRGPPCGPWRKAPSPACCSTPCSSSFTWPSHERLSNPIPSTCHSDARRRSRRPEGRQREGGGGSGLDGGGGGILGRRRAATFGQKRFFNDDGRARVASER